MDNLFFGEEKLVPVKTVGSEDYAEELGTLFLESFLNVVFQRFQQNCFHLYFNCRLFRADMSEVDEYIKKPCNIEAKLSPKQHC